MSEVIEDPGCLRRSSGQALLEFIFLSILVCVTFLSVGALLRDEWKKCQCAYVVFERTHAYLTGRQNILSAPGVKVLELEDRVEGIGRCGRALERVELPILEYAEW